MVTSLRKKIMVVLFINFLCVHSLYSASSCLAKIFCCAPKAKKIPYVPLYRVEPKPLQFAAFPHTAIAINQIEEQSLQIIVPENRIEVVPLSSEKKVAVSSVKEQEQQQGIVKETTDVVPLSPAHDLAHTLNRLLLPPVATLVVDYCQCYWAVVFNQKRFTITCSDGSTRQKIAITVPDGSTREFCEWMYNYNPSEWDTVNWIVFYCYDVISGHKEPITGTNLRNLQDPLANRPRYKCWYPPNTHCEIELGDTIIIVHVWRSFDQKNSFADNGHMLALAQAHQELSAAYTESSKKAIQKKLLI